MSDLLIQEIKTFESLVRNMYETLKNVEGHTEELKSISNLLERIAQSMEATRQAQEKMAAQLERAWSAYQLSIEQKK